MTTEVLGTLLSVQAVIILFLIRTVWRLNERLSKLEGRLNGNRDVR